MSLHDRYQLTKVVNAAGTLTPLGVSRSSTGVAAATAQALQHFFLIDELQDRLSARVARMVPTEAACLTHCVSAGLTLSVAAAMTHGEPGRVAALPDTSALPDRVVLPAIHAVDYGHPIEQDVRLAGASVILAGVDGACTLEDVREALAGDGIAALLLVSSRLVRGEPMNLAAAVALAHQRGVPAIIDGAAQDLRMQQLLATGADLVLLSAHKYLGSPTAGLVLGKRQWVDAVRAQEKGIGRAMKPSKEALVGVLQALEEREAFDREGWQAEQALKVTAFIREANALPGIEAVAVPDPAGMPFSRARITLTGDRRKLDAVTLARSLRNGEPPVWVMSHRAEAGELTLELVALDEDEIATILRRLRECLGLLSFPG